MPLKQPFIWHELYTSYIMAEKKIFIGTSGWHYKHWIGTFYPKETKANEQLAYFLKYFDTVEINNSFYRLPTPETFDTWKRSVPDNFLFSVKASRFITHMKKLKDPVLSTEKFFNNVNFLGEKLGPILFQLPPSWQLDYQRLEEFMSHIPAGYQYTFEFRNETWYNEKIYDLLKKYNCAFCIYEIDRHLSPFLTTADFIYIRLHGPGGKYEGSYSDETLSEWSDKCLKWKAEGKKVYIYFDNDQAGYAAFNALRLKDLISE